MKQFEHTAAAAVCCAALALPHVAIAQTKETQVPIPKTASKVAGPVPGNTMTTAYVCVAALGES